MIKIKNSVKIIFAFLILSLTLNSCLFVRNANVEQTKTINLSPKPTIPMSEEIVRSPQGDMIAFLPQGWFFVDVENSAPSEIFAVAVNPDYTLSAVFSKLRKNEAIDEAAKNEGAIGLARIALSRHIQKAGGAVKQVGAIDNLQIGDSSYGIFELINSTNSSKVKAAAFISSQNEYYQFSLAPLDVNSRPLPNDKEMEEIFKSILVTIQY